MFGQPDFAKAAFAELADQRIFRFVWHAITDAGSPAENGLFVVPDDATRLLAVRWRRQRRDAIDADFEDLERLGIAFEQVRPMRQPPKQRPAGRSFRLRRIAAYELTCVVESLPCQKNLPADSERHDARGEIGGEANQITAARLFDEFDLTEVNADAGAQSGRLFPGLKPHPALEYHCEPDGGTRRGEVGKVPVARVLDDVSASLGDACLEEFVVSTQHARIRGHPERGFELGRADDIAKENDQKLMDGRCVRLVHQQASLFVLNLPADHARPRFVVRGRRQRCSPPNIRPACFAVLTSGSMSQVGFVHCQCGEKSGRGSRFGFVRAWPAC